MTLHADGSGVVRAYYRLPVKGFSREQSQRVCDALEQICARTEGLTALESTHEDAGGGFLSPKFQRLKLKFSFSSKDDFSELHYGEGKEEQTLSVVRAVIGKIDLKFQGLNAILYREVNLSSLLGEYEAELLTDSYFRYRIHFPTVPRQHNAHSVSQDGQSLTWHYLLRDYSHRPMVLSAQVQVPLPQRTIMLVLGSVFFLLMLGSGIFYVRRQKSKLATQVNDSEDDFEA